MPPPLVEKDPNGHSSSQPLLSGFGLSPQVVLDSPVRLLTVKPEERFIVNGGMMP